MRGIDTNIDVDSSTEAVFSSEEVEGCEDVLRVIIFGESSIFQTGLSVTLQEAPGIELIGEWDRATASTGRPRDHDAHVAILDLDVWGVKEIEQLCSMESPLTAGQTGVLAVTSSEEITTSVDAICAGARAVLLKDVRPEEFVDAVHAVHAGAVVLAQHLAAWLVDEMLRNNKPGSPASLVRSNQAAGTEVDVTPRQQQTLTLLAAGMSNAEIAEHLDVSRPTVKSHVSALLRTFNVRDRTQLAIIANQRPSA